MLRIAICDDSKYMRDETKKSLLQYSFQRDMDMDIDEYKTGEDMLKEDNEYDIIFMDYQFENHGADGITIAREIRKKNKEITIIFLSSYPHMVFDSFEVNAYRFLVKPIDERKLFRALDSFMESIKDEHVLTVRVEGVNHFIREKEISYVEGLGKNCLIHYGDRHHELEVHETLAAVEARLSEKLFYRCHKSFLVNLQYVESYSHTEILLHTGESVLISRSKYKKFSDLHSKYLIELRSI